MPIRPHCAENWEYQHNHAQAATQGVLKNILFSSETPVRAVSRDIEPKSTSEK